MKKQYKPSVIESKWQAKWEADGIYHADIDESKPKFYALTMLPYPSGNLHIGHWYSMTPPDARARFMRMQGYNVMFPMGFDSFGLPAENAALKHDVHPKEWTYKNIEHMRGQLKSMGGMFDWRREAISSDPEYYKWSQWFFTQLYKHKMAYRSGGRVDFCPTCNTTLAREQVWGEDKVCERCGTPVIKKELDQWYFTTTKYVEDLLDYEGLDWPGRVRTLQTNWMGRSEGASVVFHTEGGDPIEVFTTRPDTLWGATFMVLSPEHPLVEKIATDEQRAAVEHYQHEVGRLTDIERESTGDDKEKTGVFTGGYAINPVNGAKVPIWIADYVLMGYGTGAIMAVPAHDQRDFEFARHFDLEIIPVIQPEGESFDGATMEEAYSGAGVMINSAQFDGIEASEDKGRKNPAISAVIDWLEADGKGKEAINYRLRDWLISRQRYWGAPIPMIHCETCGINPVPDEDLPVVLPDDIEWRPTGESPLKFHPTWRIVPCPVCGEEAERDTDTMDTFMCSSWYHLRYLSPDYHDGPWDDKEYNYWMPVDSYTGGIEHANMHLMYTRFFHKALADMGITEGREPMLQLRNQGMVLGEDGDKMSKSKGNVVAPDVLVDKYGADTIRAYLMFFSRWDQGGPWDSQGIEGTVRWVRRVWVAFTETVHARPSEEAQTIVRRKLHQTLKSVTDDYQNFEFNTIISSFMELLNEIYKHREGIYGTAFWDELVSVYVRMIAPVTPHIAEELWAMNGHGYSVHQQSWPEVDEAATVEDSIDLIVQVNGKLRDKVKVPVGLSNAETQALAMAAEGVQNYIVDKTIAKVIVVPGRLVNIVVK